METSPFRDNFYFYFFINEKNQLELLAVDFFLKKNNFKILTEKIDLEILNEQEQLIQRKRKLT